MNPDGSHPRTSAAYRATDGALVLTGDVAAYNAAHPGALVIITANVGPGDGQRLDIEVIDSSEHKNVYLSKKNISGEKRFAITAHAEEDIGVCFRNYLEAGECCLYFAGGHGSLKGDVHGMSQV